MHSLSIAVALYGACALSDLVPVSVSSAPPVNTSAIVPLDFLSYSIEFSFWGDYVGFEFPNVFTNNLMQNLRAETGGDLKFRVGGATQYGSSIAELYSADSIAQRPHRLRSNPTATDHRFLELHVQS